MRGPLIKTEASIILNQGKSQGIEENKKETAIRMLKRGKLTIEEIVEYSGLNIEEVKQLKTQLADLQTV